MFYSYQIMRDHIKHSSNQHNILKIAQLSDNLLSERSGISRAAELYKHKINGLLIGVNISGLQIRGVPWSWLISVWWKICFTGFWCAGVVVLTLDAQGFYFSSMDGSNQMNPNSKIGLILFSNVYYTSGSRGGARGPGPPPPHPKFWGPKIDHFGALSNFFLIFFASLRSAYFFFNILLFFTIRIQKFSSLASLGISFLIY